MGSCTFYPGRNSIRLLKAFPSGYNHFPPGCITSENRLPPAFHSTAATFFPNVSHPKIGRRRHSIRLPPLSTRMFTYRILTPDRSGERFNFPSHTFPDPLIALTRRVSQPFCTVLRGSPEASRYMWPTFWDILRYFCFRYFMYKSPNSPCNPPIIGFLSY